MPFETFRRQRVAPSQEPTVSIQRRGIMSLNLAGFTALGSPEAVELLYDRDRSLVGVRAVDPSAPSAYTIRSSGSGSRNNFVFSGTAFTQYYGIPTEVTTRRTARLEDDTLIIDLNDPGEKIVGN